MVRGITVVGRGAVITEAAPEMVITGAAMVPVTATTAVAVAITAALKRHRVPEMAVMAAVDVLVAVTAAMVTVVAPAAAVVVANRPLSGARC
jgi:hypothetical protein